MRRKLFLILVIIFIVAAAFGTGMFMMNKWSADTEPGITSSTIANEIKDISEYASLEYRYTNVGKFEDKIDFYGWDVPFTSKNFIISYDGTMKLGVDHNDVDVKISGKSITITLPEVKILSHEVFEDTIEVLDQTKNIFNQIEIDDYANFATELKSEMETKAKSNGIYEEATKSAKKQMLDMVSNFPSVKDEYEVKVEFNEKNSQ